MEIICLDTNILVQYWREKDKRKTKLVSLHSQYKFAVSVIVVYELLRGDNSSEDEFWNTFFTQVIILDFDIECAVLAGKIYRDLKENGNMIGVEDILIAAIAMKHKLKIATENTAHFSRIKGLVII